MKLITAMALLFAQATLAQESEFKLENESEAGLVVTSGNSDTQTYNLAQSNKFGFGANALTLKGKYLQQKSKGILSARPWSAAARYERDLTHKVGAYVGQIIESDVFAKYQQRYHSDLGLKYSLSKSEEMHWFAEAGYRFTRENRVSGEHLNQHYARAFSQLEKFWNPRASSKLWVEYLPNFTNASDYQMNAELSTLAQLHSVFSIKLAYLARYDNLPAPGAVSKTDNTVTTSLVAKF